MRRLIKLLAIILTSIAVAAAALGHEYDLVINNGRVMDPETRYDQIANVGIIGSKIAAITDGAICR